MLGLPYVPALVSGLWCIIQTALYDIWFLVYDVLNAIVEFLTSPFTAFASTLESAGLPYGLALGLAIMIIFAGMALAAWLIWRVLWR